MFDTKPGGLDGPPLEEIEGPVARVARWAVQGTLVVFLIAFVVALIVGLVWGTAWMLTHFPTV